MAIEKIGVEIEVKTKNASKSIKDVAKNLNEFNDSLDKNREGLEILDQLTGGAVSQFKSFQAQAKGGILAVKNLSASFKGLKTAILTTGIGAIVIALGLVVAYWDDIKELVSGVSEEQKKLIAEQEASAKASEKAFESISATENTLKLQGKSEKDILELKKRQTNESISALENQLVLQKEQSDAQVEALKRNKTIAQNVIRFLTLPITLLLNAIDQLTKGLAYVGVLDKATNFEEKFSGGIAGLLFDPKDAEKEGGEAVAKIEEQLTKLKNRRDGYLLKEKEDIKKNNKDKLDLQKDLDKQLEDLQVKNIKDKEAKELASLELERQRARKVLVDKGASNELLLALDENYENRKSEIVKKYDDEAQAKKDAKKQKEDAEKQSALDKLEEERISNLEKEQQEILREEEKYKVLFELAKKFGGDVEQLERNKNAKIKAINDKKAKEDLAREQLLKEQKLALVSDTFGQIANILGKNSALGRASAIAQASINTYQGVTQVWKSESVLPEPFATISKVVSTATVLASGLKAVQQIKSTPKPAGLPSGGGSGGGGSAPSGGGTPAPSFNIVGASGTNQLADVISEQTNKPQRAYVVSSDVSTAQSMDRNIVEGASI
jgi:hypothetical protein